MTISTYCTPVQQFFIRSFNCLSQFWNRPTLAWLPLGLLLLLILSNAAVSQTPYINWQKTLGGANDDYLEDVIQTPDGGYIAVGSVYSNNMDVSGNHGNFDCWVVKLDASRNIVWQRALGGSKYDAASSVIATVEGGCVIAGNSRSIDGDVIGQHGEGFSDFWIIKLDGSGNIVWQKTLGGSDEDSAHSIVSTNDGGFVIAGITSSWNGDVSGGHGDSDFWVIKLNSLGNLIWQKTFGGSNTDYAFDLVATADGGYIVGGGTRSNDGDVTGFHTNSSAGNFQPFDYWVIKLDGSGNLIWQKALGGSFDDWCDAVSTTADGGCVVTGRASSLDGDVTIRSGHYDCWVVKLDGSGNLVWQKAFGGSNEERGLSVANTTDGGYVIAGDTYSFNGDVSGNQGVSDAWLIKLDGSGNLLWQRAMGGSKYDGARTVIAMDNGEYLVGGLTSSGDGDVTGNHGEGFSDFWIVKLVIAAPTVSNLSASSNSVCARQPILFTATIGNINANYSYTITNEAGVIAQGTGSTKDFSQTVIASGSGTQSFTLALANEIGSTLASLPITINNDPGCNLNIPCTSVQSGNWSDGSTWLCGHQPTVSDLVIVNAGHTITVSTNSAQAQRLRHKGGTLRYTSAGTKLLLQGED